jgi:hypothetical protein
MKTSLCRLPRRLAANALALCAAFVFSGCQSGSPSGSSRQLIVTDTYANPERPVPKHEFQKGERPLVIVRRYDSTTTFEDTLKSAAEYSLAVVPMVGMPVRLARAGGAALARGAAETSLFSSGELWGIERASAQLLQNVSERRAITWATEGSDALRYLNYRNAEAAAFGNDIILRLSPSKAGVLEEFLHGTQTRLGIIDRLGRAGAESHVKDFMIRHQRMLGLGAEDVRILQILKDMGL